MKALRRTAVALGALLAALALAEVGLRVANPRVLREAGRETEFGPEHPFHPDRGQYVLDDELGYRPVLGANGYDELGTLENEYALEKPPGVTRLLFLGDSVTRRAKIVQALRHRLGDALYEYWVAGVEAYGTAQEVGYYARYCARLSPDHVLLTFHLNDFELTPTLFRGGDGELMLFTPSRPLAVRPWLYRRSRLYRLLLAARVRLSSGTPDAQMDAEIEAALTELRALTVDRGVRLSVLILPLLGTRADLPATWPEEEERRVARVRAILDRLKVPYLDLRPAHDRAMAAGVAVREVPDDPMHPSNWAALYFADALIESGLLERE